MTHTPDTPDTLYRLWAKPEAIASAARYLEREWGEYGYFIEAVNGGPSRGSAVLSVVHSDGSRFLIGSDAYGNCDHGETVAELFEAMDARMEAGR